MMAIWILEDPATLPDLTHQEGIWGKCGSKFQTGKVTKVFGVFEFNNSILVWRCSKISSSLSVFTSPSLAQARRLRKHAAPHRRRHADVGAACRPFRRFDSTRTTLTTPQFCLLNIHSQWQRCMLISSTSPQASLTSMTSMASLICVAVLPGRSLSIHSGSYSKGW